MLPIVYYPDPVLNRKAEPVALDRPGLEDLVVEMLDSMQRAHGIGLAAPQVGESLRLFIACPSGDPEDAMICLNPTIEPFGASVEMEEGCLSIPDIHADLLRPEAVRIAWTALDGKAHTGEFDGLWARVIQHEYDHLEGILFVEKMTATDRLRVKPDLKALEAQFKPR